MSECKHEWDINGFIGLKQCEKCGMLYREYLLNKVEDHCLKGEIQKEIETIQQNSFEDNENYEKELTDLRAKLGAVEKQCNGYKEILETKGIEVSEDTAFIIGDLSRLISDMRAELAPIKQERDDLLRQVKAWVDKALEWESKNAALRGTLEESLPILKQMEKNGYRLISRSCGYDVIEGICAICESSKHKDSCHLQKLLLQINQVLTAPADARTTVIDTAKLYIGVPFVWGGDTPNGFDCSGFTQYVMKENGITIPRTVAEQYKCGTPVSKDNLKPGDLIFFTTYEVGATHVGIYINEDKFIHASLVPEPGQVMVSSLIEQYYAERYIGARRYAAQKALTASGDNRYSRIEEAAKVVRDIAQCYKDGDCGFNEVIEVIDNLTAALGER